MPFNLYTDKDELFTANVSVKNASLKNAIARLLVESDSLNLIFNGKIENGKCKIPIRRLEGLLDENTKGKIKLEIIVENTYFSPWQDDFEVEKHTRIEINEVKGSISNAPEIKVIVNNSKTNKNNPYKQTLSEVAYIFNRLGINKRTYKKNPDELKLVLKEYFKSNPQILFPDRKKIVRYVISNIK